MKIIIKGSPKEIKQYLNDNSYRSVRDAEWDKIIKPRLIKALHRSKNANIISFVFDRVFGGNIN